jgi:hypothetical protein
LELKAGLFGFRFLVSGLVSIFPFEFGFRFIGSSFVSGFSAWILFLFLGLASVF